MNAANRNLMIASIFGCLLVMEAIGYLVVQSRKLPADVVALYRETAAVTHHLRDLSEEKWDFEQRPENLIYSELGSTVSQKSVVLIQGDSWAEDLSLSGVASATLSAIAEENDLVLINAGTTSYSVSPMLTQLRLLHQIYNIRPTTIIAYMDHTDIGDELCRYRPRAEFDKNGRLVAVAPEPVDSPEAFTVTRELRRQEIFHRSHVPALIKLGQAAVEKVRQDNSRRATEMRCGWSVISSYLRTGPGPDEQAYVEAMIVDYIDVALNEVGADRLVIATHPHRNHLDGGAYTFRIDQLIQNAIERSPHKDRVMVIDGGQYLPAGANYRKGREIYRRSDPASHLTAPFHAEFFAQLVRVAIVPGD